MRTLLLLFYLASISTASNLNDWKTITTMNFVKDMIFSGPKVWVASTGGLFSYDVESEEIERYTNVDGLHAVELSSLAMDDRGHLIVGGESGFIQTLNLADGAWQEVYVFEDVFIKDLVIVGDTLWAATNRGASQFQWNGSRYVFKGFFQNFDVLINTINTITYFENHIWLGTDQGIIFARGSNNTLEDPGQWDIIDTGSGLAGNNVNRLRVIGDRLWAATAQGVSSIDSRFNLRREAGYGEMPAEDIVFADNGIKILQTVFNGITKRWASNIYAYANPETLKLETTFEEKINLLISEDNLNLWYGFDGQGIMNSAEGKFIKLDGPGQNAIRYIIRDSNGYTWASSGKFKSTPNLGYFVYDGNIWNNIDFLGSGWGNLGNTDVIYEDRFGNMWLGSWGGGAMVYNEGNYNFFHSYESSGLMLVETKDSSFTIQYPTVPEEYRSYFSTVPVLDNYEVITAIKEDFSGRIWFGNYWPSNGRLLASAPLRQDGNIDLDVSKWVYFGLETGIQATEENNGISCFEFDDFGRVWIGTFKGGLYILDYNNTLTEKGDDRTIHLTTNDRLYSNEIRSLKKDRDGIIWIGTTGGLNSSDGIVVNNNLNIFRHIGDTEGSAGPLGDRINHIEVDNFNNKWISTSAGLSILRADRSPWDSTGWIGFNSQNSGLVDDQVHGTYIDHNTLQTYIATEKGISVYEGSFAEIKEDFTAVEVGPNPFVIDGSQQFLSITKLKENSTVRILTLNGSLVRELTSENGLLSGSRAIWDGKDKNGVSVASGIYLFLAFTEDGKSTAGKIAVIRK